MLEATDPEIQDRVLNIETTPLFGRLVESGAVSINPYSAARFAARRFAGYHLRAGSDEAGVLLDGRGDLVELMTSLGADVFRDEFLTANPRPEAEVALRCGFDQAQVRKLREFVDSLYIREEFLAREAPVAKVYSTVAAFVIEGARPCFGFFNREIWKGRYRIDERRRDDLLRELAPTDREHARELMRALAMIDRRKTTLYAVLEHLLEAQREYLLSGDIGRRQAVSQRDTASRVGVCPSVINRLIGNKAVELPWGIEIPLKALFPTRKSVLRDKVYELAEDYPNLSDGTLRDLVSIRLGVALSRRSISDYRRESGGSRRASCAEVGAA